MAETGEGNAGESGVGQEFFDSLGQELGTTRQEASLARKEAAESKAFMDKLQNAMSNTGGKEANPLAWFDNVIDAVMEADKHGKPMPITGQMATILAEVQKQAIAQQKEIQKLNDQLSKVTNPASQANQRAFVAMDDAITTVLEGMYGDIPTGFHDAVASDVEKIIRTIMTEAPDKWEQIRRSTTAQKKLVAHCAQKLVPPKAREVVLDKYEKERPTTMTDMNNAFAEIEQIKRAMMAGKDVGYTPTQVKNMETSLRHQLWELKYNGEKRYNKR